LTRWCEVARVVVAAALANGCAVVAQTRTVPASVPDIWQVPSERPRGRDIRGESVVVRLNKPALDALLRDAPKGGASGTADGVIVALPMPDATFARFRVIESSVLSPELAAAFPEIRTYSGQGIDDPTATTRFGWTADGFHAMVIGRSGTVYIDPYKPGDVEYYVSFRKAQ
jgi:hypothetical protein